MQETADHEVVIAGGGPSGMMLAGELTLAGVDVAIVEPRADHELESARSRGLHARTIEVLDQRGIAERFLAEGYTAQVQIYAGIVLDISDFPTRHNYGLALPQKHFERILGGWVDELGVPMYRERVVTGFTQDGNGVDVELSDGHMLRATYLVGCDGGRSVVRKAAGIGFPGWDPTTSWLIAEAEMDEQPEFGLRHGGGIGPAEEGLIGVVLEEVVESAGQPSLEDLRAALIAAEGTDYGLRRVAFVSRFTDMTRQAASYREGRILLAGDAAHIHAPVGGLGMNVGVQDAVNLGWKLAQVVRGTSPEGLLDTYHAERHPVGAGAARYTMAQMALRRPDARTDALRDAVAGLLGTDEPRKRLAGMISGLDIRYDLGEGHPLVGRRMPDLDLVTADGRRRLFTLLHAARPVLVLLDHAETFDVAPWAQRVRMVEAGYDGPWELPVLGEVPAPPAVLIRPDGHVAWAGDCRDPTLPGALTTWFGPPAAA
jgi:2-polyprenyl-6-methoxyphenol hydroxylase-like FAD-dependent oxidoreductase